MLIIVATMFVVLFAFLAGGLWIGWTLAVTGTVLLALFRDIPLDKLLAQYAWNILTTQELLALPLFILGFLLAACFMAWIMIYTAIKPSLVPAEERKVRIASAAEYLASVRELGPAVFLILCVLGSMCGGLATPSEAAGVGVLGALIVARLQGELKWPALRAIGIGAVQTCSMIALIVLGASILGSAAAFLSIPAAVAEFVTSLQLSPFMLIIALIVFYLILGCFLDGFSMIVMTLPIVMPIVKIAGFDPIWFGIFLVLVVEMAQITPPVGFNLFVIQGLTEDGLGYIARVTLPYLLIMVGFTMVVTIFPDIALWLPRYLSS